MKRINLKKQNSQDERGDVASYNYLLDLNNCFLVREALTLQHQQPDHVCLAFGLSFTSCEAVLTCNSYRPSNYFLCLFHLQTKLV